MKTRTRILLGLLVVAAAIYVGNASWRASPPSGTPMLIAHRGTHQNFDLAGVGNDTCTATRIREPIVPEIENTLPSMRAAFEAGADVVELDVHPTTDGKFAVFHDWTLDCRTEGTGETRSHDMAYLKALDVGYGYSADSGKTYPLRGTGVAMMPELEEVLATFPNRKFLINFKSKEAREGDMLAAIYDAHPEWQDAIWGAYGGDAPTLRARALIGPGLLNFTRKGLIDCLLWYEAVGWSGYMPDACRGRLSACPSISHPCYGAGRICFSSGCAMPVAN